MLMVRLFEEGLLCGLELDFLGSYLGIALVFVEKLGFEKAR